MNAENQSLPLRNLRPLKADMIKKGWSIDAFLFHYKKRQYIVLVKLFNEGEFIPKYALVKMEFIRRENVLDSLEVYANSGGLDIDAKTLRSFFEIEYGINPRDILVQFYYYLGGFIPEFIIKEKTSEEKKAIVSRMESNEENNPDRIYCIRVKRNPHRKDGTPGQRSQFNGQHSSVLRPFLYEKLCCDTNLSFCYSCNPEDEKTDEEILRKFTNGKKLNK